MKILCDIDGVLCENGSHENYATAVPRKEQIELVNSFTTPVTLYTSRLDEDRAVTEKWLKDNGVKYGDIIFGKEKADLYIDDKACYFIPVMGGSNVERKELTICMSGGMDSYVAYHYAMKELGYKPEEIFLLNFNIGQPYADKEKKALDSLGLQYHTINVDLIRPEFNNVPTETKYIIPARNMLFSTLGAMFGKKVWIVGMKFENHYLMYDKNDAFFRYASLALSQAVGEETIVETPFGEHTKTDIIKWAVDNNVPNLSATTSCYHPTKHRCGECSLCFKRYIAMKAAGISEDFDVDPTTTEEASKLKAKYREAYRAGDFSHYQKDRIEETFAILGEEL